MRPFLYTSIKFDSFLKNYTLPPLLPFFLYTGNLEDLTTLPTHLI